MIGLRFALMLAIVFMVVGCSGSTRTASGTAPGGDKPAAAVKVGTRENPVPVGEAYTFRKSGRVYDITVTDGERNAAQRVKGANQFNTAPPAGSDYIVTRVRVDYKEGSASDPFRTPSTGIEYYAGNRMWGAPSTTVAEEPKFSGQNIFPGASVDGWLGGKHVPTELMADALLVFDGVYFAVPE